MEAVDTENRAHKIEAIKRFVKAFVKAYFGGRRGTYSTQSRCRLWGTPGAAPGHIGAMADCQRHLSEHFPFNGLL